MLRLNLLLLLAFLTNSASADVLDHNSGLLAQLLHQLFSAHHLPFTVLVIVVGIVSIRRWRAARK